MAPRVRAAARGALISFTLWSFGWVSAETNSLLLIAAIAFGIFMAFNIGGNDVANSFGPSVGAGTLTMKQALIVAAVFEVSGAVLAGGEVTDTVRSGIVELAVVAQQPMDFVFIMAGGVDAPTGGLDAQDIVVLPVEVDTSWGHAARVVPQRHRPRITRRG